MEAPVNPRPYQQAALDGLRASIRRGNKRIVMVAPTGAGKTVCIAAILQSLRGTGLVLAHREEIIDQTSAKLTAAGVEHGIIKAGRHASVAPIQVASVQTLCRRLDAKPPATIVIADECHHVLARTWSAILEAYSDSYLIGTSATPYRLDGRGLGEWFDDLVVVAQVDELIAAGWLVPPVVFAPSEPDVSMVPTARGDFNQRQLAAAVDRPTLIGDVIATWRRLASDRTTVVFAVGVDHSLHLVANFRAAGVTAAHLDAETPAEERAATLARVAAGEIQVLSNVGLFTEGWDLPRVACVVMARPTQSRSLYRQMAGRGLRPYPGKRDCLILDHAGNVFRHGLPQEPEEFSLAGVQRRKAETVQSVRTCPACFAVCAGGTPACPQCGEPFPVKRRPLVVRKGELEPMSARAASIPPDRRAEMLAKWELVAREKGYRSGYALAIFRSTFGQWPDPSVAARARELASGEACA